MADENNLVILKQVNAAHGQFVVSSDPDGMQAYLSGKAMDPNLAEQDLVDVLLQAEVTYGIQSEPLQQILECARKEVKSPNVLVAEGTEMVRGQDAHLEFDKKPTGQPVCIDTEDGKVDYREVKRFDNVKDGDRIAVIVPPQPGKGGTDIYGKIIPPPRVKDLSIEPGENIRFAPEENAFYATSHGHVIFQRGLLSVSPIYHVKRDVDMSHGNIRFIGSVDVTGDVLDDFEVTAAESITVGGTAEACSLLAGGGITIRGGVTGKGKGKVRCKGKLTSRYLNEVHVVCESDVIVEKEIVNARVFSLGRVVVERGTIVGGEVVALRGILTRTAGSDLGVKTALVAGIHYDAYDKVRSIADEVTELHAKQQKLLRRLGERLKRLLAGARTDRTEKQEIDESMSEARTMQKRIEKLEDKSGVLFRAFEKRALPCLAVSKTLNAGVRLVTGQCAWETAKPLLGPLTVEPDPEHRTVNIRGGLHIDKYWSGEAQCGSGTVREGEDASLQEKSGDEEEDLWTLEEVEELYLKYNPAGVDGTGQTVVVGEDQPNMRSLICKALEKRGFLPIGTRDGLETLREIQKTLPACCVLDIAMPKLSGLDVLEALRKDSRYAEIPVIICTARKERSDVKTALSLGAQAYIIKPFEMNDLVQKVAECCANGKKNGGNGASLNAG